ncbi:MAG TPA: hypothetical protein VF532_22700 [Candidatus Angelobacter sp.]
MIDHIYPGAAATVTCRTVFQISQKKFYWESLGIFLLLIAAAVTITWLAKRGASPRWKSGRIAVVLISCLFVASLFKGYFQDLKLYRAYERGEFSLVEGLVEDFRPMPFEGHQEECFSVKAKRFCYSDFEGTAAFKNTASHGGPIRAGLRVRIAYVGNDILRLEIASSETRPPD